MNPFDDSPISRRDFVRLSAATGAALSLPGNATADAAAPAFDVEYSYVQNHTPADHSVPTLVRLSNGSGLDAVRSAVSADVLTTETPEPAAYAKLTTNQALTVASLPTAETLSFSPGSNPFWRIGYHPLGVFPEPKRSVDFVSFEQLKDGLRHLEREHPNRLNVERIGDSPGHHNRLSDRTDPKGMYVAEVTNGVDDEESFRGKEKVFYSLSLHGLERAGAEAGSRMVENVLRGDEAAGEIPSLLDDVVILFCFTNPDGWAVRNPQYDSGWQTGGPGAFPPRAPAAPLYERGNAAIYDTNRQYPTVGYITPDHYPGEPRNPAERSQEKVTDALAIVDHFRSYENLNYGADLHGGPIFNEFVLGLISQDQYTTREMHEVYEMCRTIDKVLEEALETWVTAGDAKQAILGDFRTGLLFGVLPEQAFDYATIYDTIDYTVTGAMLDWMSHPEHLGGLGMTTLDFEMAFSHITGGNVYNPELLEMEVTGYRTAIRTITKFAVQNSETPNTNEEFAAKTDAGGDSVAYVTTGEVGTDADALRRTEATLEFGDGVDGNGGVGGGTSFERTTVDDTVAGKGETLVSYEVADTDLHSLSAHVHAEDALFDLELVAPDGSVIYGHNAVTDERVGGKCCGHPEWVVAEPNPGEWTIRVTNVAEKVTALRVQFGTLASESTNPDPDSAVGYEQYNYDVTPFRFFEDYADSLIDGSGTVEPVTVEEVADGALVDGDAPAYDHVVVIHNYGANSDTVYSDNPPAGYTSADHPTEGSDEPGYTDALDAFVDAGGNLVLTDAGVTLVADLDNEKVGGVSDDAISVGSFDVARYMEKNLSQPLLTDVRSIQNQLWKVTPLGYKTSGEAPMYLVDLTAFETGVGSRATASVAATTDGAVATGSYADDSGTGVHLVSSLLPPATQRNLHPFGLLDYTVSFLGYLVFTSALGFEQVRATPDGETRFGRGDSWDVGGTASPSATRSDDGSVFTAGQTNHVELDVTASEAARARDRVPDGWAVRETQNATVTAEGDVTYVVAEVTDAGATFEYFAEAPEESGQHTFGPIEVRDGDGWTTISGSTKSVTVVGVDQTDPGASTADPTDAR